VEKTVLSGRPRAAARVSMAGWLELPARHPTVPIRADVNRERLPRLVPLR
jgi:hypothetical protein